MNVGFYEDVDAADAVKGDLFMEVFLAGRGGGVSCPGEVGAVGAEFFVAWVFGRVSWG